MKKKTEKKDINTLLEIQEKFYNNLYTYYLKQKHDLELFLEEIDKDLMKIRVLKGDVIVNQPEEKKNQ